MQDGRAAFAAALESFRETLTDEGFLKEEEGLLPYNLYGFGPFSPAHTRLAGWLRAIAREPRRYGSLIRWIRSVVSPNGMGSPHTVVSLFSLVEKQGGPARVQRRLHRARARANEILRPYGLRVSNAALAEALTQCGGGASTGRIAVRAAGATIRRLLERWSRRDIGLPARTLLEKGRGMRKLLDARLPRATLGWVVEFLLDDRASDIGEALHRARLVVAADPSCDGGRLQVNEETRVRSRGFDVVRGIESSDSRSGLSWVWVCRTPHGRLAVVSTFGGLTPVETPYAAATSAREWLAAGR